MVGNKKTLTFTGKMKIAVILAFVSIFISTIFEYFFFFFVPLAQRTYSDSDLNNNHDSLIISTIAYSVLTYLIIEIVFTILYLMGKHKSQLVLFVSTLIHFVAQIFLIVRYSYGDYICISIFIIPMIIDFYVLWAFKNSWLLKAKTNIL